MARNETPEWLDETFEREEISPEEYYRSLGMSRVQYWRESWRLAREREEPVRFNPLRALFKWLFG